MSTTSPHRAKNVVPFYDSGGVSPQAVVLVRGPSEECGWPWFEQLDLRNGEAGRNGRLVRALAFARGAAAMLDGEDELWACLRSVGEYKGQLMVEWRREPEAWMARCLDLAWGDYVFGDAPQMGGEEVYAYHAWPGKGDPLPPPRRMGGIEKTYTLAQLRQAWGAGAWAAKQGRA